MEALNSQHAPAPHTLPSQLTDSELDQVNGGVVISIIAILIGFQQPTAQPVRSLGA